MKRFRCDNTDGYEPDELAELNTRYEALAGPFGDGIDKAVADRIAEQVQAEFDSERA